MQECGPLYLVSEVAVLRVSLLPGAVRAPPRASANRIPPLSVMSEHRQEESKCLEKLYILLQLGVRCERLQIPGESSDECLLSNVLLGVLNFFLCIFTHKEEAEGRDFSGSTGDSSFFPRLKIYLKKKNTHTLSPLEKKKKLKAGLVEPPKKSSSQPSPVLWIILLFQKAWLSRSHCLSVCVGPVTV